MPNYYELLRIQPTATDAEIANAIDQQYEQWRRLVTHHDPNVVNQANQAIQLLEKIRATLTDPAKRAVYDEAIGVRGATAGLVDPNAVLNMLRVAMTPPPPPRPPVPTPTLGTTDTVNAWICPKCGVANGIGTRFCKNCGNALGRYCPNCSKTIEAVAKFCPECGVDVAKALVAKQIADEEKRTIAEREAQKQQFWKAVKPYAQNLEPATHDASLVFFVRGTYDDCVQSVLTCLSSRPGDYKLNLKTQDGLNGTFVAYEGSANELRIQVLVETGEDVQRRIFVRFARNTFPVDKPMRRIRQAFEDILGKSLTVLRITEV